jgi:hypothetical protein
MAARARGGRRARVVVRRRWLIVGTVLLVGFLYSQPLRTYLRTRSALERRSAEVSALRQEQRALQQRLSRSLRGSGLLREARRIGYVKPGERLYIVEGIEAWRRHERHRSTIARHG